MRSGLTLTSQKTRDQDGHPTNPATADSSHIYRLALPSYTALEAEAGGELQRAGSEAGNDGHGLAKERVGSSGPKCVRRIALIGAWIQGDAPGVRPSRVLTLLTTLSWLGWFKRSKLQL